MEQKERYTHKHSRVEDAITHQLRMRMNQYYKDNQDKVTSNIDTINALLLYTYLSFVYKEEPHHTYGFTINDQDNFYTVIQGEPNITLIKEAMYRLPTYNQKLLDVFEPFNYAKEEQYIKDLIDIIVGMLSKNRQGFRFVYEYLNGIINQRRFSFHRGQSTSRLKSKLIGRLILSSINKESLLIQEYDGSKSQLFPMIRRLNQKDNYSKDIHYVYDAENLEEDVYIYTKLLISGFELSEFSMRNTTPKDIIIAYRDSRSKKSLVQEIQSKLNNLNENGKLFLVSSNALLFRGFEDNEARHYLIDNHLIESIISLPEKLGRRHNIFVLNNQKNECINMIDLSKQGIEYHSDSSLIEQELLQMYLEPNNDNHDNKLVSYQEVIDHDYILSLNRYIEVLEEESLNIDDLEKRYEKLYQKNLKNKEKLFKKLEQL